MKEPKPDTIDWLFWKLKGEYLTMQNQRDDLLEVCENLVALDVEQDCGCEGSMEFRCVHCKGRAAITKAKGES
jgi:hypothetical protein